MSGFQATLVLDGCTDRQAWIYTTRAAKAGGPKKD